MNAALYEQFVSLKNAARKTEAKAALAQFIASFETGEEKRAWVFSFLESIEFGDKIRQEIYVNLVYPVLLDGYLKNDVSCITWLAQTATNLQAIRPRHPALLHKGDYALFKEAHSLAPNEKPEPGYSTPCSNFSIIPSTNGPQAYSTAPTARISMAAKRFFKTSNLPEPLTPTINMSPTYPITNQKCWSIFVTFGSAIEGLHSR